MQRSTRPGLNSDAHRLAEELRSWDERVLALDAECNVLDSQCASARTALQQMDRERALLPPDADSHRGILDGQRASLARQLAELQQRLSAAEAEFGKARAALDGVAAEADRFLADRDREIGKANAAVDRFNASAGESAQINAAIADNILAQARERAEEAEFLCAVRETVARLRATLRSVSLPARSAAGGTKLLLGTLGGMLGVMGAGIPGAVVGGLGGWVLGRLTRPEQPGKAAARTPPPAKPARHLSPVVPGPSSSAGARRVTGAAAHRPSAPLRGVPGLQFAGGDKVRANQDLATNRNRGFGGRYSFRRAAERDSWPWGVGDDDAETGTGSSGRPPPPPPPWGGTGPSPQLAAGSGDWPSAAVRPIEAIVGSLAAMQPPDSLPLLPPTTFGEVGPRRIDPSRVGTGRLAQPGPATLSGYSGAGPAEPVVSTLGIVSARPSFGSCSVPEFVEPLPGPVSLDLGTLRSDPFAASYGWNVSSPSGAGFDTLGFVPRGSTF